MITTLSIFQKANDLNLPLSVQSPQANASLETPNSVAYLTNLITEIERVLLINALGVEQYNELKTAFDNLDTLPNDDKYKLLILGDEYNGKVWEGLQNDYSLIAYKIKEVFLIENNQYLSGLGVIQTETEKSNQITPHHVISSMSNKFAQKYQLGYMTKPMVIGIITDWYGDTKNIFVSLFEYLRYKDFDISYFKSYETYNSFGL